MKSILLITAIFLSVAVVAQQNFEGTISYNSYLLRTKKKDSADLIITFGKNAILLEYYEKGSGAMTADVQQTLIRLDSGKVYIIHPGHKTYRARDMEVLPPLISYPTEKNILGYKTTSKSAVDGIFVSSSGYIEKTVYVSDKLVYAIPEKFRGVPELMMLSDGKIVLGANLRFLPQIHIDDGEGDYRPHEPNEDEREAIYIVEAREIKPHTVPADRLSLPVDFTNITRNLYEPWAAPDSARVADSVAIADPYEMVDTVTVADTSMMTQKPIETKPAKSKPSKPKSKSSSKSSPARKPE